MLEPTAILTLQNWKGGTDKVWFIDMKADGRLDDKRQPIATMIFQILSTFPSTLKKKQNVREQTSLLFQLKRRTKNAW